MARENRDPDYDRGYRRPAAWRKMKDALGDDILARAMVRLEKIPHGCPRVILASIIHHYLALGPREQVEMIMRNLTAPPETVDVGGGFTYPVVVVSGYPVSRGGQKCKCLVDHYDRVVKVTDRVPAAERARLVAESVSRAVRPAQDKDRLPASPAKHVKGETVAAAWKRLAPPGWPLPPNLPDDVRMNADMGDRRDGWPPMLYGGPKGWDLLCPHCGRAYGRGAAWGNHVEKEHGWTRGPGRRLNPPSVVVPSREQVPARDRGKWDAGFGAAMAKLGFVDEGRAAA